MEQMEKLTGLLLLLDHIRHLGRPPTLPELGEHAWLRVFSSEDLEELSTELGRALIAARGDEDTRAADECLKAWRLTARQLEDRLRRSVLTSRLTSEDLVDAPRPEDERETDDLERLRETVRSDPNALAAYQDTDDRIRLMESARKLRRQLKLSQAKIAVLMATSRSAVSDMEAGRVDPPLGTLQRYARALGARLSVSISHPDHKDTITQQVQGELHRPGQAAE